LEVSWKIGGEAGYGILAAGLLFAKTCARGGLNIFGISEYPSLIRGGHNVMHVRASVSRIYSQTKEVSLLVALNQETIDLHAKEISQDGALIFDSEHASPKEIRQDIAQYPLPLLSFAKETGEGKIMMNTVSLGATIAILGYDLELLEGAISDSFSKKPEIIESNLKAARLGYGHVKQNFQQNFRYAMRRTEMEKKLVLNGNDAMCAGAIRAGCKFLSAYPMTPTSGIIHFMAAKEREHSLIVKQTEDEIAAINMAIGASFAGARSMTCTSGGGFSLMVEGLGYAGSAEIPIVIVEGQRPGPSTGMPTWTSQADLKFVLSASQGEFPRIVIAPGDAEECFYLTGEAFNLADRYQCPVILLTDKYLAESLYSLERLYPERILIDRGLTLDKAAPADYKRYQFTESGISPRAIPPIGLHKADGEEHDESGLVSEDAENRRKMMDKRMRKLDSLQIPEPSIYGAVDSGNTLVGWGSTKGPALEALKMLEGEGVSARYLHLNYILPFPTEPVLKLLEHSTRTAIAECNHTAQMASLIREYTGIKIENRILKYDGRPFYPEEIFEGARKAFK